MRIPNVGEFLAIFAATGQLSDLSSKLSNADSEVSLLSSADSEASLHASGDCHTFYEVRPGDTCNSIALLHHVPTYQIICGNEQINGKCTNLIPGDEICLGRQGADCRATFPTVFPFTTAVSIAERFHIPLGIFGANNYCIDNGEYCPPFNQGTSVCIAPFRVGYLPTCEKIFA